ncbi:ATP-dependent RNA helicase SUB2 [Tritrichomonas foetus]|uniref:RNA helicase n=1 Tax=Tritrichomonas foetus TaxID=1144522 RepID=A0A1J4K7C3_9EUKA|nr:ATP-dependent RNA helicase SUB2 [Tritrichomonas foetus]|eukprot:OHT07099.1 ATP-dependent RNA helicase SUB2 [Tritrichomonas foetus]
MADPIEDELLNYEEVEEPKEHSSKQDKKGFKGHVAIHSAGFRDFLLIPELMHAIGDNAFEHPSEVQQECIPHALLGSDIICQGQSGMGKTAVFVISILQQLDPVEGEIACLVIAPTRELAYQIGTEFNRFSAYMKVKTVVIYGGMPKSTQIQLIKDEKPNIIVATPGRCQDLIKDRNSPLNLSKLRFFVIDEADKVLEHEDMKKQVQDIYNGLPNIKQTMLFTATMPESMKEVCRKFTRNPTEIYLDDKKKLTLHGLQQFYTKLEATEKNRKLLEILDNFKFNQVVIFVSKKSRAKVLDDILNEVQYPSIAIHSKMPQIDRIKALRLFKNFSKKILVSTDLFARGIDVERVNIVINYDMPQSSDTYLHRVGRAGRFGTKGLAISFVSTDEDVAMLEDIQKRFTVEIPELPENVDAGTYMNA